MASKPSKPPGCGSSCFAREAVVQLDGLAHGSGTLLGRFMTEEPAAERAKEKSNFRGEREIGGHADENAEHQPSDRADADCGSGTQGAHPTDHAPAFMRALLFVQSGHLTEVSERLKVLRSRQ
jgi:hypothetical protein